MSITAQGVLPSSDIFRLRNVATGLFLTDAGASAQAVTMTNLDEDDITTHWTFVESGAFYNIDNKDDNAGILRAPGAGGPAGPFVVVSTNTDPPASDTDKIWTVHHNATDDTYRFQYSTLNRYMYHDANGTVTNVPLDAMDDRFNWELVPYVQTPVVVPPDEDTRPIVVCTPEGQGGQFDDIPDPQNVGSIDDRSCYADYTKFDLYGKTWGVYNITEGSNPLPETLQPRIERFLPRSQETGVGSYARFTGTFRILEVGDDGNFNADGTYIAQAKGKHTGGGGSADPAICLYRAHPVYGTGINAGKQVAFDIYAERITERGGEGVGTGREVVFLKQVDKDEVVSFELEVGFREDPSDPTKKIHYCDAVIGGDLFEFNIPDPERGLESGIRYGAYRVRGGRAQIRWADTTYEKVEVVDSGGAPEGVYRFKNVATGEYLKAVAGGGAAVTMTSSGEAQDTHWTFLNSGAAGFHNINNGTYGILRAPNTHPFEILCTSSSTATSSGDKIWAIEYNALEDTYRFERGTNGSYLYQEVDGTVIHISAPDTDDRSKWILESTTLSSSNPELKTSSIKVYPNPAQDKFTITFNNINGVKDVEIYSVLGKRVYKNATNSSNITITKTNNMPSGIYLVKAKAADNRIYHSKLVVK
ncbi:T9SS type A sorting domain-containing protein [Allotamlana fucoidanivorans]|nr:T9SS type A sorting domain-containing protein [Tamlana fucoidanivorans]